jgi:hypothetical protein
LGTNLAVNEVEKQDAVKVYPNPAKNILNIDHLNNNNPDFKIYDVSGKILIKGRGAKVDWSALRKGIYFIKVENLKPIKIIKD